MKFEPERFANVYRIGDGPSEYATVHKSRATAANELVSVESPLSFIGTYRLVPVDAGDKP